jgi:hypothetical protein
MAPYFVQLRELERRLLRGALVEADGDLEVAAGMLGVSEKYATSRCTFLGGVLGDEPRHEPPGRIEDAHNSPTKYRASMITFASTRSVANDALERDQSEANDALELDLSEDEDVSSSESEEIQDS